MKWQSQAENALLILKEMQPEKIPADRMLATFCKKNHKFGSRDRHFFHLAVFAFYRYSGWLRFLPEDPALRLAAALLTELPDPMPPAALYLAGTYFPNLPPESLADLTKPERFHILSGRTVTEADLIPDWAVRLTGRERIKDLLLTSRSPLWVRVADGAEETAEQQWRSAGLQYRKHPRISNAYAFPNERIRFEDFPIWKSGLMEMQDFSSQCIGLAAEAKEGEHWFDPCAGGGGKTMQLAAMMRGKGKITVHDIRTFKIDTLMERAARSPFRRMIQRKTAENVLYDGVLLDAPCTSSGRWRRSPDSRWVKTEQEAAETAELQYELLVKAAESVRPGGKLVYGTCSVFALENRLVAERFLAEHGDEFECGSFASPHTGEKISMLQTYPADADCDGSFAAVFRRKTT